MKKQRCRMYRLRDGHHDPVHEPKACRRCWASCRQEPAEGHQWCAECEHAAATCGDLRVVAWLDDLTQPTVTGQDLVDYLSTES